MDDHENRLTEFERFLLGIVAKGKGRAKWSWHSIGIRTYYCGREGEEDMLVTLKRLEQRGFVKRHIEPKNPEDHWEITEKGEAYLSQK